MDEIRLETHHVYHKKPKTKQQLMKEARSKRNVNPSRKIRHVMVEKWEPLMNFDHMLYDHCYWEGDYDNDVYDISMQKPTILVQTGDWELMFNYP